MDKKFFLILVAFSFFLCGAFASVVSRDFNATSVAPSADVRVTIIVSITSGETYYAIDENIPSGWTIKNAGTADRNQAGNYSEPIRFVARKANTVIPPITPDANKIFGQETVEHPNYMIVWFLAITVISGTIIVITRLRPVWFRIFLASTYTTVPFVVNYYMKSFWLAMIITCIETLILNYLLYEQWKRARIAAIQKLQQPPKTAPSEDIFKQR